MLALFQPDFVLETFAPGTGTGGSDDGTRALRDAGFRPLATNFERDPCESGHDVFLGLRPETATRA